jgi:hypothetical protein
MRSIISLLLFSLSFQLHADTGRAVDYTIGSANSISRSHFLLTLKRLQTP